MWLKIWNDAVENRVDVIFRRAAVSAARNIPNTSHRKKYYVHSYYLLRISNKNR